MCTHKSKLDDRHRDEDIRALRREPLPVLLKWDRVRVLDCSGEIAQDIMHAVVGVRCPVQTDRLQLGADTPVVEEALGQDAEEL